MAVTTGVAEYVAVVRSIVQSTIRFGDLDGNAPPSRVGPPASYTAAFGYGPAMMVYAMRARRHFELYGTSIDDLATVAVTQRDYAANNPNAVFRKPLTVEDHHNSRVIVDPFRLFDCCMESDGAAAVIVTTPERAKDLKAQPIYIGGVSTTTAYRWSAPDAYTEPDEFIASSGHAAAAADLWRASGAGPEDVDAAGFYDGSSISPILAVEDWGFCPRGEGASFIRSGAMRVDGVLPINTSGGNLSEAFMQGINHLVECVRQLRGTSHNQVTGAEVALYASGQGLAPMGGILVHR
jgi:acetyl-CoA acetyltransferase